MMICSIYESIPNEEKKIVFQATSISIIIVIRTYYLYDDADTNANWIFEKSSHTTNKQKTLDMVFILLFMVFITSSI